MRIDEEQTMLDLCKECGVPDSSNIVQCLRVLSLRMASCPGVSSWEITNVNDVSILYRDIFLCPVTSYVVKY